ncbi:hypothetical protein [Rhodoblastus sp.]|uniref:hypothetical protein n=1 Tax=Rhodoblastus sp. TaxID=1962975 RepID=UPI003F9D06C3
MVKDYTHMSAPFEPGAENVEKALEIYEEMQGRNDGGLAIIVKEDGGRLWIQHGSDGQGNAVEHAVGFVAECARRFSLPGIWSATWSRNHSEAFPGFFGAYGGGVVVLDLATQFAYRVTTADMLSSAHMDLCCKPFQKAVFPFEVTMKESEDGHTEWLKENVEEGHWSHFARALTVEDGCLTEETVFLFKDDAKAVEFKLKFG